MYIIYYEDVFNCHDVFNAWLLFSYNFQLIHYLTAHIYSILKGSHTDFNGVWFGVEW